MYVANTNAFTSVDVQQHHSKKESKQVSRADSKHFLCIINYSYVIVHLKKLFSCHVIHFINQHRSNKSEQLPIY